VAGGARGVQGKGLGGVQESNAIEQWNYRTGVQEGGPGRCARE
jgi:hypothetical protein